MSSSPGVDIVYDTDYLPRAKLQAVAFKHRDSHVNAMLIDSRGHVPSSGPCQPCIDNGYAALTP